jgi:hypothetical protein
VSDLGTPLEEIVARLRYQAVAGAGRLLDGWKVHPVPVADVKGLTDFPYVMLFIPDYAETVHVSNLINPRLTVRLFVARKAKDGIPALMRSVAAVLNAIERTRDGQDRVDPNLNETTRPIAVSTGENFALDLSLNAQLTITIEPKPFRRGRR